MEIPVDRRSSTARTTVKVALGLVLLKLAAWAWAGHSLGVLGSALDSLFDVVASLLVLWAVVAAERPADAEHPWGHGKAEGLASLFQSIFILASGLLFLVHTVDKFSSDAPAMEMQGIGIAAMVVSSVVTMWLVRRLRKVAAETGSPALAADSKHYASDVLMNLAVIIGLALSWLLDGTRWPDLAVGLGIALLILNAAREVFKSSLENLMDRGLKPTEAAAIVHAVAAFAPRVSGFHDLRSRRSGADIFLELHLDLNRHLSFVEAHDLAEEVSDALETAIQNCQVTVHADPL